MNNKSCERFGISFVLHVGLRDSSIPWYTRTPIINLLHPLTLLHLLTFHQMCDWRIHGRNISKSAGCWLVEKRANEGGSDGRRLGKIDGCIHGVYIGVNSHSRKVRRNATYLCVKTKGPRALRHCTPLLCWQ